MIKGAPSVNPNAGKPIPIEPSDDGVVTPTLMRKVLGQSHRIDKGPTEKRLREWLVKDPKGFIAAAEDRERQESEDATLRATVKEQRDEVERLAARVRELEASSLAVEDAAAVEIVDRLLSGL